MLEFNYQEPVALVEYKHMSASVHNLHAGRYEALRKLCDGFHRERNGAFEHNPIPCIVARYDSSDWSFIVTPLNETARMYYGHCIGTTLTEHRFVKGLLLLRHAILTAQDDEVLHALNGAP